MNKLHYTPITWNVVGGGFAAIELKGWIGLDFDERRGAIQLGYNKNTWDCFIDHYRSWTWDQLRLTNVDAYLSAMELGWTRTLWDNYDGRGDDKPESDDKWWANLTDEEQIAANGLCYFRENWDQTDMNPNPGYFPHPLPAFRYVPWRELSADVRRTAREGLGYIRETWNAVDSNPLEASDTFFDLNLEQQAAAQDLGFYPHTWDCHMNHFNSFYWNGFYGDAKVAVETLGWTAVSWDYSDETLPGPATESKDWSELSSGERAAATVLCYFGEIWDDIPITEWYDYEEGVNTAVSLYGPMPQDIDMSIFRRGNAV